MKRFELWLAAAAAIVAVAAPLSAGAAAAAKPAKVTSYSKEELARGAKEAPAVLARSGLKCTATGSAYQGSGEVKDPVTKKTAKQNVYEVACQEGLGYALVETAGGGEVKPFDCLTLAGTSSSSVQCRLPGNQDAKAQIAPLLAASGRTCSLTDARSIGSTGKGDAYYEVACQGTIGFIIKTSAAAKPEPVDCASAIGTQLECKFTSKEQVETAQKAQLAGLIVKTGRTCSVSGTRTVGRLSSGEDLYEVACGAQGGFMLAAKPDGSGVRAVDCGKADQMFSGGCQLTNSAVAQTQEAATYTRISAAAGFPCNVSKYRFIGMDPKSKSEVVELVCSNRPDGGVGLFPADNSRGKVYDCVQAGSLGQRCQFSSPDAIYAKYTQSLVSKGRTSCKVSNARWIGRFEKEGTDLIETACSDGQPGLVVEMAAAGQVKNLLSCGQAKAQGVACQLPGNTK